VEEVDGVEDKGLGDTKTVSLQMVLEAFLNMFLRSACSVDEALFLVKSQTFGVGTALFRCQFIRISGSWNVGFKEFYCVCIYICIYIYILTYLLTYLLTPWCRVLLEKLAGFQLVKKFPAFHGT